MTSMNNDGSRLRSLKATTRASAEVGNKLSEDYTKTVSSINGRVVVIAIGSASLLFTFIGILYGSSRDVASLEYKYVILAIAAFLLSSSLLLISGWFTSVYRHSMASKYYQGNLIDETKEEMRQGKANGVIDEDGKFLGPSEVKKYMADFEALIAKLKIAKKQSKKDEVRNHLLYRVSLLLGYVVLLLGYIFTLLFFIGVINIINN